MPGIFSSSITSARLSSCGSFNRGRRGHRQGIPSYIRNDKYGSERHMSADDCSDISENTFRYSRGEFIASQRTETSSNNEIAVAATRKPVMSTDKSLGFYSNKEKSAMIFKGDSDEHLNLKNCGRRKKQRQYRPSRSSSPCEWGYFVDTN